MTSSRRHFGHVRRLASGRYQAGYWHDGRRHIGPTTFRSKADANAFLDAVSASIGRGDWVDPELSRISFGHYAEPWLAQRTDIRARTKEYYGWLITNRLVPAYALGSWPRSPQSWSGGWYADLAAQTPASPAPPTACSRPSSTPPSPRPHPQEPLSGQGRRHRPGDRAAHPRRQPGGSTHPGHARAVPGRRHRGRLGDAAPW